MKLDKDSILNTKFVTNDFEIDFNELAKMKFDKLLHRLQVLDIEYIFLDMDGTIVEYYNNRSMFIDNWFESLQFYYKEPLLSNIMMVKRLSQRLGCKVFILSGAPNNVVMHDKLKWLENWVDFVDNEDIFFIGNQEHKINSIEQILETFIPQEEVKKLSKEKVLLIDDELENLRKAEHNGYSVLHVSSLCV